MPKLATRARGAIVCIVAAALAVSTAAAAPAERTDDPALVALRQLSAEGISEATAVLDGLAAIAVSAEKKNAISAVVSETRVVVPQNPADGIVLESTETGESYSIGLPFSSIADDAAVIDEGIVAYDNLNGSTTIPLVKEDGSVQIATVIDSEAGPTRYEYLLDTPLGAAVSLVNTGEVIITGSDGEFIGGISAAWAYDADGAAVPTHYELEGSTLTQVVEHDGSFTFPVVADPWAGNNLLVWAGVSYYSGYYAVDAQATAWGRTFNGLLTHASHVSELKYKLGGNAWRVDTNGGTIREQFLCHVAGNFFEPGLYNMESYRPSMHWANQLNLKYQCNPY